MSEEYAGGLPGRQPVVGDWKGARFTDGTTTEQTVTTNNCKLGGLIPAHGGANAGAVTISNGVKTIVFAISSIPVGGLFFGGGMRMDKLLITVADAGDDIIVLYRESDFGLETDGLV